MPDLVLGIEIGGTKLQFGVGNGPAPACVELVRRDIDRSRGAEGILEQIGSTAAELGSRHQLAGVGYGFGGPVDHSTGCVVTSHQVQGWTGFPLRDWTQQHLGLPAVLGNDCDVATLAEATFGTGKNFRTVFYLTVGTGIGGGLVIDGALHGADRPAVAEIGHLRPGLDCVSADQTVESLASGLGMEQSAVRMVERGAEGSSQLLGFCDGDIQHLTGQMLATAAAAGNEIANQVLSTATQALGWAIAQMITLVAPDVVVVGGGVSMMPAQLFLEPLREAVDRFSFGPLKGACAVELPTLGEEVVVHGAILNAAQSLNL